MKYKGIPKKELHYEYYMNEKPQDVPFDGLKKKHVKLNSKDVEKDIDYFSIVKSNMKRTFAKSSWGGMEFENNQWYPVGYEG